MKPYNLGLLTPHGPSVWGSSDDLPTAVDINNMLNGQGQAIMVAGVTTFDGRPARVFCLPQKNQTVPNPVATFHLLLDTGIIMYGDPFNYVKGNVFVVTFHTAQERDAYIPLAYWSPKARNNY